MAGVVVGDPGCLQFDHPPGGVVHLCHGQAEPVPQALESFAAGPGDQLLQLPPVGEVSRTGGGARHGCGIGCGQVAWALLIGIVEVEPAPITVVVEPEQEPVAGRL